MSTTSTLLWLVVIYVDLKLIFRMAEEGVDLLPDKVFFVFLLLILALEAILNPWMVP